MESLLEWHEEKDDIGNKRLKKQLRKTGLIEIDVHFLGDLYKEIRYL